MLRGRLRRGRGSRSPRGGWNRGIREKEDRTGGFCRLSKKTGRQGVEVLILTDSPLPKVQYKKRMGRTPDNVAMPTRLYSAAEGFDGPIYGFRHAGFLRADSPVM